MSLVSFVVYVVIVIVIGFLAYYRQKKGLTDFLVSSRDHNTIVTALSASASSESGWVTLGLVGAAYTSGVSCFWLLPGCLAGYLFNWLILGPRIQKFSASHKVLSIPELLETYFVRASGSLRLLLRLSSSLIIVLFLSFYVSAQFTAGGKALEAMFGWKYSIGVTVTAVIILFYSVIGGLRAISWTDLLQAVLMVGVLVIMPVILIYHVLSASSPVATVATTEGSNFFHLFGGSGGMAAVGFVVGWLGIGCGYPGQPHVLKRFLAAKSNRVFKGGLWIALCWSQLVFAGAIIFGMAARKLYPNIADPEQTLPIAAVDLLPGILAGLVMAAVFSAICSTGDSQLLEAGSAASYDIIGRFRKKKNSERELISGSESGTMLTRATLVIVGLCAWILAATSSKVIFWFVLYSWAALGASLGTVLSVMFLWKRCSAFGAFLGLIIGPLTVVVWRTVLGWHSFLYELVPAFLASILGIVLGSIFVPDQVCKLVNKPENNSG